MDKLLRRHGWLVIDGLPFGLIRRLTLENSDQLPTLSRLDSEGRVRAFSPTTPNCQTPPSLAALFSGSSPEQTGICGFDIPHLHADSILDTKRAFDQDYRHINFIWDDCARIGLPIRLSHVPFVNSQYIGSSLISYKYGYRNQVISSTVWNLHEARSIIGEVADSLATDYWTIVALDQVFDEGDAPAFGLARLSSVHDGTVYFSGAWRQGPSTNNLNPVPFIGSGVEILYRQGMFGDKLQSGGSGEAERILCDALRISSAHFMRCWLEDFQASVNGLIISYNPVIDLFLHECLGYLTRDSAHWSVAREELIRPMMLELLRDVDHTIELTIQLMNEEDRVLLSSDHGMSVVELIVRPNTILFDLGYLSIAASGAIDVHNSAAFYHPAENGLLCFNKANCAFRGLDILQICSDLKRQLFALTGRPAEISAHESVELQLRPPSWLSACHFLDAGRYVQAKSDFNGLRVAPAVKTGEHVVNKGDPDLLGTFVDLSTSRKHIAGRPSAHELRFALDI